MQHRLRGRGLSTNNIVMVDPPDILAFAVAVVSAVAVAVAVAAAVALAVACCDCCCCCCCCCGYTTATSGVIL